MKATTKPRAAIYVRVSTEEQALHGVSLDAQEDRARAYCTLAGLEIAAVYRDAGVSAAKPLQEREAGAALLYAIRTGGVRHVVALKLDRLFRNAIDAYQTSERWDKQDVGMHLVDMGGQAINTRTASGKFLFSVLAAAAEMERNLIGERTSAALAEKQRQGQRLGAVPLGFRARTPGGPLEPVDAELAIVGEILNARASKRPKSFRAIAATLTKKGTPTKQGGRWAPQTVAKVWERRDVYRSVL